MNIKKLLLSQIEKVVFDLRYDFLYEDEYGELLCQVIQRDSSGSIESTPISFHLRINEEKGTANPSTSKILTPSWPSSLS
ncbi:hypothetical protein ABS315_17055 [Peribacillus frigoritolerans]|uniref:hypothetical protein n=1 Tax=Peribacillus frigoritolerans TaxID=450367 RepID=UPI0034E08A87